MHKQTHKRAFYTLAGCIAALALCVAASLFLLTPAPKAQDVTIPGTRGDIYATVQLPGKLARGAELPLVVLCHGFTGSRSGEFFALRVRGESMLGVGILPDDLVVVRRQQTANNGEIVVALIGDEATVKTFKKQNGEIWLLPANPDYQLIDGRECEVLGKVVAVVRQY